MTNPEESDQKIQAEEEEFPFNEEEQEFYNAEDAFNEEEQEWNNDTASNEEETIFSISNKSSDGDLLYEQIFRQIQLCSSLFVGFKLEQKNSTKFTIEVPTSVLPLATSVVNSFINSPVLLECTFDVIRSDPWRLRPVLAEFKNPYYGNSFPGLNLVKNRINSFFSNNYKPQEIYRCQCYALTPQACKRPEDADDLIRTLVSEGFPIKTVTKALEFCNFNIEKARDYIIFGSLIKNSLPFDVKYSENPIFFLILEICEAFFDISDCCCVCGEPLGIYGLKSSCCSKTLCQYSFLNLGVGSNIINEIKRDPLASDFIIALAGAAYFAPPNPPVFDPSPKSQDIPFPKDFFNKLPSMNEMCRRCQNDDDLINFLGLDYFKVLRFFILANRAQLMTIPDKQRVNVKAEGIQFLISFVSPESELIFRKKRDQYGVKWLWHGSLTDRWHMILHTGLKDFGQTEYTTHGPPYFGKGIYMSESFSYSYWYCTAADNRYKKSVLPKQLLIISLVENAAGPGFSGPVTHHEYTQKDDQACITRVLLVMDPSNPKNKQIDTDTIKFPPFVPNFQQVLLPKIKKYFF